MPTKTDNQSVRSIRLKERFNRWFPAIIVGLAILALLGGWLAYGVHIDPATETEEEVVSSWDEHSELSHFAEVTQPNAVFEENETLTNQQTYFTQLSPELNGEYEYYYTASEGGEVDVEITAELVLQSLDDDDQPYWEQREPLEQEFAEAVEPGESVTVPVSLDVAAIEDELEQIEDDLGASVGTTAVAVQFDTRATGSVNDESVSTSHQDDLDIDPDGETFTVEANADIAESHETTVTHESEVEYGLLHSLGSLLLLGGSLIGLGLAVIVKTRDEFTLNEAERRTLTQQQQRTEYDDWISVGSIPNGTLTGEGIHVETLEDLVDVAIDTNNRVIEDVQRDRFVVVAEDWYYTEFDDVVDSDRDPLAEPGEETAQTGTTSIRNSIRLFAGLNGDSESVDGGENGEKPMDSEQ